MSTHKKAQELRLSSKSTSLSMRIAYHTRLEKQIVDEQTESKAT